MFFEPSKKLSRMLAWWDKLHAQYQGTWCELFKTKGYLKHILVYNRLTERIRKQIEVESKLTYWYEVQIHRLHPFNVYRRDTRKGYRYIIECIPQE